MQGWVRTGGRLGVAPTFIGKLVNRAQIRCSNLEKRRSTLYNREDMPKAKKIGTVAERKEGGRVHWQRARRFIKGGRDGSIC